MNIATILLILGVSTLNVVCFLFGLKLGQKIRKDEPIQVPTLNPLKAIREREHRRIAEKEQRAYDIIQANIDNYDGTELSQKDVPM